MVFKYCTKEKYILDLVSEFVANFHAITVEFLIDWR